MMITWIKRNKLVAILGLALLYVLIIKPLFGVNIFGLTQRQTLYGESGNANYGGISLKTTSSRSVPLPVGEYAPTAVSDRLVVQESSLSLVVKDIRGSIDKMIEHTKSSGGYMISSSLSQPEEAPYGTLSLRIPAEKLKPALEYFRSLAVKVASENLYGTDVTDEYEDIDARLETLDKIKAKFEEILARAEKIPDLLEVQRELINLQAQIDSLKGRQQYLEKTAAMAKVTLYLSTDEYVLPYAPAKPFRPAVIFKEAVRSLVGTLRGLVKMVIWVGVYGVIIVPAALVVLYFKRRKKASL